jgi:hypothetical protein
MATPLFDAVAVSGGGGGPSATVGITVGSNPNRILVVDVAWGYNASTGRDFSGGGLTALRGATPTAMTPIVDSGPDSGGPNRSRVQSFYLLAPDPGTNPVVVTLGAGNFDNRAIIIVRSYYGVDQTAPIASSGSSATNIVLPSAALSGTTSGNLVIDAWCYGSNNPTLVAAGSQSQRSNDGAALDAGSDQIQAGSSDLPTAGGSVTMSWTGSNTDNCMVNVVELAAVSGGGGGGSSAVVHAYGQDLNQQ